MKLPDVNWGGEGFAKYDGQMRGGESGPVASFSAPQGAAQLATTNAVAGAAGNKANALEGKLVPGYTSLMDTGYLSPEEAAAATTSEMGATTAPFEATKFGAANRAAATRNPADLAAQEDVLAGEEGRAAGTTAANLQKEKMLNQMYGMTGLGNIRAGDLQTMAQMYGLGPGTLGTENANASQSNQVQLGPFGTWS